ncbi:oxidoreductase [Thioalkalivibrio sp. HK1]|uniref:oxidoreductase n=1 Tax=Thioalkalivibrio sp. HK1 TaxID=1469245 RepID=UPI0004716991|nr:oxidoreductase [Thioalkalivibrio sp. HK1]
MEDFLALRVHRKDKEVESRLERITLDDISEGDVVIRCAWSDINYKDALAVTGKGRIMKRFPMVAGIDVAGTVHHSQDPAWPEGTPVVVTGFGLGEEHDGGYGEYARVPADWLVGLPEGLSQRDSMAIGTAGFTAALAVDQMERNRQRPDGGPILVNGATGGVGSFAIDMLAGLGYEVVAFTGKRDQDQYLRTLGAKRILYRDEVEIGTKPLEKPLWAGAVDNVGGRELAWLTRTMKPGGNIASIGLAGGFVLETTVMPFILRGVNLLGINSVYVESAWRQRIWQRLASDLKPRHLDRIVTSEIALADLPTAFDAYINGKVTGRAVVRIAGD